jgi:two-component system, cell cycle response regulator CtrA
MRLLVVESKASLQTSLICDDRSFTVHADTPDEALSILRHEAFDLVVLDITSFSEGGFSFIRRLRTARNDTPLVALTGRHADDRVRALSLGADDAISKPADPGDLRARIAAVSRRHKGLSQSLVQLGALSLSLESREVRFRGMLVHLTAREYSMLELLVLRKGQVVSKDLCRNHLYGGMDEPGSKIIEIFVCKLRRKLSDLGCDDLVETIWGQGYRIREIGDENLRHRLKSEVKPSDSPPSW